MNRKKSAWINGLFFVITLAINAMGASGLINGLSQKQISDMYITLITPSPSTFSIWSIIYTLLLISVIVMIIKKDDPYYVTAVDEITLLFRISCMLNIGWIIAFSYVQIELSVLFIFGFVIILSMICQKLLKIQDKNHWLLPLTFGIYTGWLVIATVVNVAAALVKLRWNRFGIADDIWAIIILTVSVLLVAVILSKIRNAAFPLPVAWAYFGIYQFLSASNGFRGEFPFLQTVALSEMIILICIAAFQLYKNRFSLLPNTHIHN